MQAEALLTCSCGMWGLGFNDRFERGLVSPWLCSGMSFLSSWHQVGLSLLNNLHTFASVEFLFTLNFDARNHELKIMLQCVC